MQAQASPKDEFVFAALLFCSAIPYNEVISVFLVERLGPFLALACAAVYCITLYMRAGKAPGRDWLAWFPVPLTLSVGAAGLGVATALLITYLGYRPPHNLIAPAPLAAKMIIATTIGPLWEELLTRGILFRALSGNQATPRRAIIAVLVAALVFSLAHLDKDWVGRMWAFASGCAYGWIRLASRSTIPAVIAHQFYNITVYNLFLLILR